MRLVPKKLRDAYAAEGSATNRIRANNLTMVNETAGARYIDSVHRTLSVQTFEGRQSKELA